ncbi:glycosyltransferase family 2 protein [Bacteroides faecichinchillae]|uniref:glycosyltransferase family 2 protein n=1 Tax=Bacteroides faecichinchillae TaxID=871325 RepID=UPI0023B958FC|nr:glycosyltransferase [Bacteroides faecichinchillae]
MDVDIVVPIYNAFDFVKKCIETVVEYTDLTKHTLLLINDKSTDKRILPLLNSFIENNKALNIKLIDNKENRGFVGTVNIGMQYSQHDVILLNSDTEVTKNWLLKIQNCAYSKSAVATVTPLSNNATLASVPDFLSENVLPPNITVDEYAEIVEKCSMNLFPEIPTAHGFCMYIKREAIDDIGFFR